MNDAAEAVVAAAYGRTADALAISLALAYAAEPPARLLGRVLTAWFSKGYPERGARVFAAIEVAHGVVDPAGNVHAFFANWRFGHLRQASPMSHATPTDAALQAADPHSRLAWALRGLLDALGGGGTGWTGELLPGDELITLPWITDLGFGAAVEVEPLAVPRRTRRRTAAPCGSVRHRRTLERCSASGRTGPAQRACATRSCACCARSCLMALPEAMQDPVGSIDLGTGWGDQISRVLQRAERSLTSATANALLDAVERHPVVRERFPQVAMGVWRHVGDDQVGRLLDALDPGEPGQVVNAEEGTSGQSCFGGIPTSGSTSG